MSGIIEAIVIIASIAFAIISVILSFPLCGILSDVLGPYLGKVLDLSLERRRAEHEAKIKLIKGLD